MGKFGKRSQVKTDIASINFCLLGESGIGKTTTMARLCEQEFGPDGYIILDMGKEDGLSGLDGYTYETCENWKKFDEVTNDIIKNKNTDYPNLKVVLCDTADQLCEIATPYVIDLWNRENLGKKGFEPAKTLNAAYGGFGKGDDKLVEIILDKIWKLKSVGVNTWMCGHVKIRNKIDAITQEEYSVLSTDLQQRVFEGFKTKMDIVAIATIDRTITAESTGRKNIVTKQDITVKKIKDETRKIVFRSDNYSVDSKSRFEHIKPEIPLDPVELAQTLKDALASAKRNPVSSPKPVVRPEPIEEELPFAPYEPEVEATKANETDYENLIEETKLLFKSADSAFKAEVRAMLGGQKLAEADVETIEKIYDYLKSTQTSDSI